MRCDDCRFWERSDDGPVDDRIDAEGWCRRYPPTQRLAQGVVEGMRLAIEANIDDDGKVNYDKMLHEPGLSLEWEYPATECTSWCGEFQPKTEGKTQ